MIQIEVIDELFKVGYGPAPSSTRESCSHFHNSPKQSSRRQEKAFPKSTYG